MISSRPFHGGWNAFWAFTASSVNSASTWSGSLAMQALR